MGNPLRIFEGIFQKKDNDFLVITDGVSVSLSEALSALDGKSVTLKLHHFPPIPPLPQPGGGSCMWPVGLCPHGHVKDPTWMYARECEGVLTRKKTDWNIDDGQHLFGPMEGHRGRLVVFYEADVAVRDDAADLESLMSDAGTLLSQFEALKKAMGEP